jgi:hypothetical protein
MRMRSGEKPRFLLAGDGVVSADTLRHRARKRLSANKIIPIVSA